DEHFTVFHTWNRHLLNLHVLLTVEDRGCHFSVHSSLALPFVLSNFSFPAGSRSSWNQARDSPPMSALPHPEPMEIDVKSVASDPSPGSRQYSPSHPAGPQKRCRSLIESSRPRKSLRDQ